MLAAYALNVRRVLVITPSVKISEQIHEAFCGNISRKILPFLVEREIVPHDKIDDVRPSGRCVYRSSEIPQNSQDPFMVVNAHKIGSRSSVKIEDIPNDKYDLVIVDEAHHYPAPTWKLLVDHFNKSKRLFLTATPHHKGKYILDHPPCFELTREDAVKRGIIRKIEFQEEHGHHEMKVCSQHVNCIILSNYSNCFMSKQQ